MVFIHKLCSFILLFIFILSGCKYNQIYETNYNNESNTTEVIHETKKDSIFNNDIIYVNDELGFEIRLPSYWENYYKIIDIQGGIKINFYGKSMAGAGATISSENGLTMFFIVDRETVESNTLDGIEEIGIAKNTSFYFATPTDASLSPIILNEEFLKQYTDIYGTEIYGKDQIPLINQDWIKAQQMLEDIPSILETFTSTNKTQ